MAYQIQIRRGSAALWAEVNPILAEGELALELDTQRFKIGDGIHAWNNLNYASGPQGPQGPQGIPGNQINKVIEIPDVVAGDMLDGSLLIYDATTEQWNVQTTLFGLNMDGGEF